MRGASEIASRAFDGPLLDPFLNERDLFVRQAKLIGKPQLLRLGKPGRHEARCCESRDLAGAPFCVSVGQQRKGTGFPWVVAGGTVMENDGSDIAIEGDLFWPSRPELELPGFVLRKSRRGR